MTWCAIPVTAELDVLAVAQSSSSNEGVDWSLTTVAASTSPTLFSLHLFSIAPRNRFLEDPNSTGRSPSRCLSRFILECFNIERFSFSPTTIRLTYYYVFSCNSVKRSVNPVSSEGCFKSH